MKQGTVSIATGIPPVLADRNVHEIVPVVIPFRVREGDGVAGKTETERLRNVQDTFRHVRILRQFVRHHCVRLQSVRHGSHQCVNLVRNTRAAVCIPVD